jgi:PAS domain S-box-containing protein
MEPDNDFARRIDGELPILQNRIAELERCEQGRLEAFHALQESERTFRDLLNSTEDIAFLIDGVGTIIVANQNAARLLQASLEEMAGATIYSFIPEALSRVMKEKVAEVIRTHQHVHFENAINEKVVDSSIYPVFDENGGVDRLSVYVHDITDRKQMEAALQQAEEKYRNIYENATEGIFQTSREGRFLSANPSLARIHGYETPEEMIGTITDIGRQLYVDSNSRDRFVRELQAKDAVQNHEVLMRRKDGTPRWISMNARVVRDENGNIRYYEGTMQDVTARKGTEEALKESEERYRTAIEHSNDGVAIVKGDNHLYVNRRFVEMFGYERAEDIVGTPVTIVVHPDDRLRVQEINNLRQRGIVAPSRYEFVGMTKDGRTIYIEVSATSTLYKGEPVYLVYLRDVSARKKAEEELRLERNKFQTLSENAPFGIAQIDQAGTFTYLNPKFTEIFGYDRSDVPDGRTWFRKAFPDHAERREARLTWIRDLRSAKPGERKPRTFLTTCKDGTSKMINFIPVRLATGEHVLSFEDITERIRAQEALVQSHKELEALNRAKTKAVHHISHELKTPLAVIQGNLRLLKRKMKALGGQENEERFMEALERNVERLFDISKETDDIFRVSQELEAGAILNDLERLSERIREFSEMPADMQVHWYSLKTWLSRYIAGSAPSFQSIDLYPAVLHVVERVKRLSAHRSVHFQVEGVNDLFIFLDPGILSGVIEGLLRNAVENTPDEGVIKITVERRNDDILLHVSDSGVGITDENQAYLFDGLFHTRETELYASKRPYEFGAGGKGLDLLRMKVYGQRFGFDLSVKSKRCIYIPTDLDVCPGEVQSCPHVKAAESCLQSGGTTFTVTFAAGQPAEPPFPI